ncbi:MAG: DUF192 domain-containing protein [Acidimicrobiales bacterium]
MRLRRGDDDLGPVERAVTIAARTRGLLGRTGVDGALVLSPASSVHTIGMRFAIDVAHLDADLRVLRTTTMAPHRLGRPVRGSRHVLEAEAGTFARWGLCLGDVVAFVDDGAPVGHATGDADDRRGTR